MNAKLFLGLLFFGIVLAPFLAADPASPVNLQIGSTGGRILGGAGDGTISAQGGNVTQVNVDALTITKAWQGYYGNITGSIHLDNSVNQSFYIWGNATPAGEVYATRSSTITWAEINCSNASNIAAEETYLGVSAVDGDSVSNTFNETVHPQFLVGTTTIDPSTCPSMNLYVNGGAQNDSFYQILLADNESNVVYTTIIEDDIAGYNGEIVDFQLMVGENEHAGSEGPSQYYFFVELS